MPDTLGDRMKRQYENRTRFFLPRRTYTLIRVDGQAFHTLLHDADKPFDTSVIAAMNAVGVHLCEAAQGACLAYVQSDEVSLLLTDFATIQTEAWFDNNLQKLCSSAASLATQAFNAYAPDWIRDATFDARAFTIPDPTEVENYFIWRQQDAERNSLMGLCQQHYSHQALHGQNRSAQHELLHAKGVNWADLEPHFRHGWTIIPPTWRPDWTCPVFTRDRAYLRTYIPRLESL